MTEQPPSAERRADGSIHVTLSNLPGFHFILKSGEGSADLLAALDQFLGLYLPALIAQRVSAETERCREWMETARTLLTQLRLFASFSAPHSGLVKAIDAQLSSARAERPAPPIPELSVVRLTESVEGIHAGTEGTVVHVYPGSALAETGYLVECHLGVVTVARSQIELAERPAPEGAQPDIWTEEDIRAGQAKANELVKAFEQQDAVGDYTERALTVARDAIEGIPSHLLPCRINSEEIAQAISPDIAGALSAVASERDAAAIRAFGQRVWSDSEEIAYQAGVSDARARLREPDVREALRSAFMGVPNWQVRGAPTNVEVAGDLADAAIARIGDMLK